VCCVLTVCVVAVEYVNVSVRGVVSAAVIAVAATVAVFVLF